MLADYIIAVVALPGHVGLWAGLYNRVHATGWPEWLVKLLSATFLTLLCILPLDAISWLVQGYGWTIAWERGPTLVEWLRIEYAALCLGVALGPLSRWAYHRVVDTTPSLVLHNDTTVLDVPSELGFRPINGMVTAALSLLPGNDFLRVHVQRKEIVLPRLPAELDGLSIAHLSDFHFCGRVTRPFFERVVEATNALQPDLIALTGDYFDRRACLDWIGDTLGRLRARYGVYYVLGNHDLYIGNVAGTRLLLSAAGLIDLGGRVISAEIRGQQVILAGNELPWHAPAAAMDSCPPRDEAGQPLRILLSHSPDQLAWARGFDVDLMLAGHTHGGQVRLPLVGPLFVPSRLEVRYSAGVFHEPPTVLHVTRGLSGKTPLRVNCPAELALLVLRGPRVVGG